MAQISDLQRRDNCLVWVTERPHFNVPRYSSRFGFCDSELKFELKVSNPYGFDQYEIILHRLSGSQFMPYVRFDVTIFIRGERSDTCFCPISVSCYESRQIWCWKANKTNKLLGSDLHRGRWTVTIIFPGSSLWLRVPGSEVPRSVKAVPEDKCVQASIDIPPDLESLSGDFRKLLEDETFPDVKVRCGDRNIRAHRSILAVRSEVFSAMFRNRMSERKTGTVDITDLDSDVLDLLLQYVYSGKIPDLSYDTASSLYEAGDKYSIHALKKSCSDWMVRNLTTENCLGYLVVADAHSDEEFKERVVDFAAENLESIKRDDWFKFNKDHPLLANSVYHKRFASTLVKQA